MLCAEDNYKFVLNWLTNKLHTISGKIPLEWFNKSVIFYEIKCKKLFLQSNTKLQLILIVNSQNINVVLWQ
jgi:hypothetical protein